MENYEKTSISLELAKEQLGKKVTVTMDRPLGSTHPKHGFVYDVNYGYIAGIKAPDGEDLDAYFLGVDTPIQTGEGVCIAIAHRRDNDDDKLIVVPEGVTMTDEEILSATHFQEQWFDTVIVR
jgi:inorganic pyrophosphatase